MTDLAFVPWISEELEKLKRAIVEMHEHFAQQLPIVEEAIRTMDPEVARALVEDDDTSPIGRITAYQATLWTQHGWFPSAFETPLALVAQTSGLLGSSRHKIAERIIASYFKRERAPLVEWVIEEYPDRASIIADAMAAHDEGRFSLSIPVFLIQADGIGASFFGIDSIYTASEANFAKIRLKYEEGDILSGLKFLHFMVGALTPLNASRGRRAKYPAPFNRHTVIHGESTDYATETNSLKCISWLRFVAEIACRI